MIRLIEQGNYRLIETKSQVKILALSGHPNFAWVMAARIGEILVTSRRQHKTDHMLAVGRYAVYEVKDEPMLTDLDHLELEVGGGLWQGYLLPRGLPSMSRKRHRIIPTDELVELVQREVNVYG